MTAAQAQPGLIDATTDFGRKVLGRLADEQVVWLTTVGSSGTPQPNPVWFRWHDGEFLVFSKPDAKVRNIQRNSRVSLNLNSTAAGGDVVVFTGTARIADERPAEDEVADYTAKYTEGLRSISLTAEQFYAEYSVPLRIIPDRLRGF